MTGAHDPIAAIAAAVSTPPAPAQAVPDGWTVIPQAGVDLLRRIAARESWQDHYGRRWEDQAAEIVAMLDATPTGPVAQPVAWVSPGQLARLPADPGDAGGAAYLPIRHTLAGNFTQPLYATPTAPAASGGEVKRLWSAWSALMLRFGHAFGSWGHGYAPSVCEMIDAVAALTPTPTAPAASGGEVEREDVRKAVARCLQIVRETCDGYLLEGYATPQPIGSFTERFACSQVAEAIGAEFGMGTTEQRRLLGMPTMGDEYRAALTPTAAPGSEA